MGGAFSRNQHLPSFCLFRFLTGAGIGGEYSAINSAIQELIPARYRGRTDLAVNGSFWLGGALGAAASLAIIDPALIDPEKGWRLAFLIGAVITVPILLLRRFVPESPRWLVIHGRAREAERILVAIEAQAGPLIAEGPTPAMLLRPRRFTRLSEVIRTLFVSYRRRALVGLALMGAQAFFYNAIFFTYALVLTRFYDVAAHHVGWHVLPFALANFLGPLTLGPLFDTLGRRPMIAATYALSGLLLAFVGALFALDLIGAGQMTAGWAVIFFFASAAASSSYLTVSEVFPVEIRALAIASFYAAGTAVGGVGAPFLLGALIQSGSRASVFAGYALGAALMVGAGVAQWRFGVAAERRPLEEIAQPLSSAE